MSDHCFIVPALDGPITGGTLYNSRLSAALRARGVACEPLTLEAFLQTYLPAAGDTVFWLDSLYLSRIAEVRARLGRDARLGLLLHWLPSNSSATSSEAELAALRTLEQAALQATDMCLVTSATLRDQLQQLTPRARYLCVEPGVEVAKQTRREAERNRVLRALMIANVTPNKGVLAFLQQLAALARDGDQFMLSIIGSTQLDVGYAATCQQHTRSDERLRARVDWLGALPHAATLAQLAQSDVLVSASVSESYGMALAEARAAGVPILACVGGHIAAHVQPSAGGELVADAAALARAFMALVRKPQHLAERQLSAQRWPHRRNWRDAADDFVRQVATLAR